MPTAARVVAAAIIGFVAWIVTGQVKMAMPEGTDFGLFVPISVGIGLLCGWGIVGRRADHGDLGFTTAFGVGLSGMAGAVFWVLFVFSGNEALRQAMLRRYDGPFEAFVDMFPIAGEFGLFLLNTQSLSWLIIGGILSGVLADMAGRRWR